MSRKKVAILISGRGSNMSALIEAAKAVDYPAEIVGVFSNRADAAGLAYAAAEDIPTAVLSHKHFASREDFDREIDVILGRWGTEIICLAGFMRIFSSEFASRWMGRMLNIHPSILPKFKGLHPQQQALDAGVTASGCTVHWVVPELDAGPTIRVGSVNVLPGDTAGSLAARILVEEHKTYPAALKRVALGDALLSPDGKKTIFLDRLHKPDGSVEEPLLTVPHSPDEFSYVTEEEFEEITAHLDAARSLHAPLKAWAYRSNAAYAASLKGLDLDHDHSLPEVMRDVQGIIETVIMRDNISIMSVGVALEYMSRKSWLLGRPPKTRSE